MLGHAVPTDSQYIWKPALKLWFPPRNDSGKKLVVPVVCHRDRGRSWVGFGPVTNVVARFIRRGLPFRFVPSCGYRLASYHWRPTMTSNIRRSRGVLCHSPFVARVGKS